MNKKASVFLLWLSQFFLLVVCVIIGFRIIAHIKNNDFFSSLSGLQTYTAQLPTDPPIENDDLLNPDYTNFHRSQMPTFWQSLLHKLYLKRLPWTAQEFKQLISQVTALQEQKNYRDRFVVAFMPKPTDVFIVWGALHGAFQSLVRALAHLKQEGIIDDNLRIIDPRYYFVFNGNVINQSPYILEILTVVLRLILANPDRIFYIRGPFEDHLDWLDRGLHRELLVRAREASDEIVPLQSVMAKFFDTLPLALYLQGTTKQGIESAVRISNYDIDYPELDEKKVSPLLGNYYKLPTALSLAQVNVANKSPIVPLSAAIHGLEREFVYQTTNGLTPIGKDKGFMEWNIFSSPTPVYQKLQYFFNDVYTYITIKKYIEDWTLTLFTQDVRTLEGFKQIDEFDLATGFNSQEIKHLEKSKIPQLSFGTTLDLTKGIRIQGNRVKTMLELLFDYAKRHFLLPFIPSITILNDQYQRGEALQNVEKLLHEFHIDMLLCPLGSATLSAYLNLVQEQKVLVLFPFTGAQFTREASLKYLINLRASYYDEALIGTRYLLANEKPTRIAFFYQDDEFGFTCLSGGKKALEQAGITQMIELPYERNDVNFVDQKKKCLDFNPDAICFFSTATAAEGFIRALDVENLTDKYMVGISDMGESRFKNFLKEKGLKMIITNVVPNPEKSDIEMVRNFRAFMKNYPTISSDTLSLEVYVGLIFLFEKLKQIPAPITREKIIEAIEQTKNYELQGITYNFNPVTRELLDQIWIDIDNQSDWKSVTLEEVHQMRPMASEVKRQK